VSEAYLMIFLLLSVITTNN